MPLTRRTLLAGAGGLAAGAALGACSGLTGSGGSSGGGREAGTLRFRTWGSDAEAAGFTRLARAFEATQQGVTVDLQVVPYGEMTTGIDAELQSGTAPDVFRVDYGNLGVYSSRGALLDLTTSLDSSLTDDLVPALLQAVTFEDKVYGVPQQTDTTALLYRPDLLEQAGVRDVPTSLDAAWTWEEFSTVAEQLAGSLDGDVRAFCYDWQELGAFRWLTWLFEAGGRLLEDDLTTPAIDSDAGRRALEFTTSFFDRGWVPQNTSVKAATYPDAAFTSGQVAMAFAGNFLLPAIEEGVGGKFEYAVTYQPRDVRAASDLGGNALVATADATDPDLAAQFLAFMVEPENMQTFCEQALELPTRQSLIDAPLDFTTRPDLMPVYVEQSTTLGAEDVAQVTVPFFGKVNALLQDQLELAFRGRQEIDETLTKISDGVAEAAT